MYDKYYNRRYGSSINESTAVVKNRFDNATSNEGTVVRTKKIDRTNMVPKVRKKPKNSMSKLDELIKKQQILDEVKEEVVTNSETVDNSSEEMKKFKEERERRKAELERQENKEKEEQVKEREESKRKTMEAKTTNYFS